MPWLEQYVTAELIAGNMKVHICYLVPTGQSREVPLQLGGPGVVLVLNNVLPQALAGHLKGAHSVMLDFDGANAPCTGIHTDGSGRWRPRACGNLPPPSQGQTKTIDGRLHAKFETLYKALNGVNAMILR